MKLSITKDLLIKEVQDEFNKIYPFLKIDFFAKTGGYRRHLAGDQRFASRQKISEAGKTSLPEGEIELSDQMTVHELEKKLQDQFSLYAQVFRKGGNIWMETTMTDSWTLKDQNEHGREISTCRFRNGLEADWVGL